MIAMDRPYIYVSAAVVATLAATFAMCASAADQVEHVQTTTDADAEALRLGNALAASGIIRAASAITYREVFWTGKPRA